MFLNALSSPVPLVCSNIEVFLQAHNSAIMFPVATFLVMVAASLEAVSAAPAAGTSPIKAKRDIVPDYAITYAPYSYLYSGEAWWPSDIATHVQHVTPEVDYVAVASNVTLEDLDTFAADVYLTSDDNVEDNPTWLLGVEPDSAGYTSAPATIIVVDKTDFVDVFYFYFYSYNHGLTYGCSFVLSLHYVSENISLQMTNGKL